MALFLYRFRYLFVNLSIELFILYISIGVFIDLGDDFDHVLRRTMILLVQVCSTPMITHTMPRSSNAHDDRVSADDMARGLLVPANEHHAHDPLLHLWRRRARCGADRWCDRVSPSRCQCMARPRDHESIARSMSLKYTCEFRSKA